MPVSPESQSSQSTKFRILRLLRSCHPYKPNSSPNTLPSDVKLSKHTLHAQQRAAVPHGPRRWSETTNSNMDITGQDWLHTKRAKTPEELAAQWERETRHSPARKQ